MTQFLTVDLTALLDTSKVGAEATRALEKTWNEAKAQPDDKKRALISELEKKRDVLRDKLLARARPIIAELAKQKNATAVLDRRAVIWAASPEDITSAVIAKVDAGGAL